MGRASILLVVLFALLVACLGSGDHNNHHLKTDKGLSKKFETGYALRFNPGEQDHVELPPFTLGAPLTLELLVRPRPAGGCFIELSSGPQATYKNSFVVCADPIENNIQRVRVKVSGPGGTDEVVSPNELSRTLYTNQWNYLAITVDTNRRIEIYRQEDKTVHRILEEFIDQSSFIPTTVLRSVNFLGSDAEGNHFDGDIDEVLLFSRAVFGHQLGAFRKIKNNELNTLVGYWSFSEGSGLLAAAQYSNLHGLLGGGVASQAPSWLPATNTKTDRCFLKDSHLLQSFDNLNTKKLTLIGDYWLALSPPDQSLDVPIAVQVRLDVIPETDKVVIFGVAFQYAGDIVKIDLDFSVNTDSVVSFNGAVLDPSNVFLDNGVILVKEYKGHSGKHKIEIQVPDVLSMKLHVDTKKFETKVELQIPTTFEATMDPFMEGLCGNYNGQKNDDSIDTIQPLASSFFGAHEFPVLTTFYECDIETVQEPLKSDAAAACGPAWVDPEFLDACLADVCASGDVDVATSYAQLTYEMCVQEWELDDTQPFNCNEPCPNFCSFHGTCNAGSCECNSNHGGLDCSQLETFPCYSASWGTGESLDIEPFFGLSSVQKHYSYFLPTFFSANTGNEISESIVIYLYEDPNQGLSLVFLLDKPRDGTGGSAQVEIALDGPGAFDNLAVRVKDDLFSFNDQVTINAADKKILGQWKWWKCCTDGMAIGYLPTTFSLNFTFPFLENIESILVSQQNQFGSQDIFGFPAAQTEGLSISGKVCENECGSYTNCSACSSNSKCGWCEDAGTCEYGSPSGPRDGRCGSWRFSVDATSSRVLTTATSYPVDPSRVDLYLPSPLDIQFAVSFPPADEVPLELVVLQDASLSFGSDLIFVKAATLPIFNAIRQDYPNSKFGLGSFTDKPLLPFGSPSMQDYAYATNQRLTYDNNLLAAALNNIITVNGGDLQNSQLEALLRVADAEEVGWGAKARRVVVMITKTPFHSEGANPGADDYPSPQMVREKLLELNIVPVFVVPNSHITEYQALVNELGFGFAATVSQLDVGTILTEIKNSLDTISGSVKPVVRQQGRLVSISPPNGYSGFSPKTRVTFSASLDPSVGTDAETILTIPGYGDITIAPGATDIPEPDPCPLVQITLANTTETVIRLTGSSFYVLNSFITAIPEGELYQYVAGARGAQITNEDTRIEDPLHRVIYVPGSVSTSISYQLKDYCEACSPVAECSITVIQKTLPPVAVPTPPSITLEQDETADIILGGQDPQNLNIVSRIVNAPTLGRLVDVATNIELASGAVVSEGGLTRFEPVPDTYGNPSAGNFYTSCSYVVVNDVGFGSPERQISIFVSRRNRAPLVQDVELQTPEETILDITLDANDDIANELTFQIVTPTSSGTLSPLNGAQLQYTPGLDFNGQDFFVFEVTDSDGLTSLPATVTINVTPVNDAPTTETQVLSTEEDEELEINLLLDVVDVDNVVPDDMTVYICSWTGSGQLSQGGSVIPNGQVTLVPTGNVRYTPPANEHTFITSFGFRVKDSNGGQTPCTTVTISVTPVNDPPTFVNPGPIFTAEDTVKIFTIRANDLDRELVTIAECGSVPTAQGSIDFGQASLSLDDDTETLVVVTFTPTLNFNGVVTTWGFAVDNGPCETVLIYVNATNDPPVVSPISVNTTEDFGDVSITLVVQDADVQGQFTFEILSLPFVGQLFNNGAQITAAGPIQGNTVIYRTAENDNGVRSFLYRVSDSSLTSEAEQVTIYIAAENDAPVAQDDSVATNEDTPLAITLTGSDIEDGNGVTFELVQTPTNGELLSCTTSTCVDTAAIVNGPLATPYVLYVPDENKFGSDSFQFRVVDSASLPSADATISITINAVNDPPTANPGQTTYGTSETDPIRMLFNGSDIEGPVEIYIIHVNFLGSLFQDNDNAIGAPITTAGTLLDSPYVWYVPIQNNGISPFTSISYRVEDNGTPPLFVLQTVFIDVFDVDSPPTTTLTMAQGVEDINLSITLTGDDVDGDTIDQFKIVTLPTIGSLQQMDGTPINSTPAIVANGEVQYVPLANSNGVAFDSFEYSVVANGVESQLGVVSITLTPVNDPPFIDGLLPVITEDIPLTYALPAKDVDLDWEGDELRAVIVDVPSITFGRLYQVDEAGEPLLGELIASGDSVKNSNLLVHMVPAANSVQTIFYRYRIFDLQNASATILNFQSVTPVNDPPVGTPRNHQGYDDSEFVNVQLVFSDVDNLDLEGRFVTLPDRGTLTYNGATVDSDTIFTSANKVFSYYSDFPGDFAEGIYAQFSYYVYDAESNSTVVGDTITISYRNKFPVGTSPSPVITDEDTNVLFNLTATDDGPQGEIVFRVSAVPPTSIGRVQIFEFGQWFTIPFPVSGQGILIDDPRTLRFVPAPNFNTLNAPPVVVSYRLRDKFDLNPSVQTVEIIVNAVNDAPSATWGGGYQAAVESISIDHVPAIITDLVIVDDAIPDENNLRLEFFFFFGDSITLADPAGVTYIPGGTQSNPLIMEGTLNQLNNALSKGLVFEARNKIWKGYTGTIILRVMDQGNTGAGGPLEQNDLRIYVEILDAGSIPTASATGALVGVTTLLSAGLLGTYKLLKKKKLIAEEENPWEAEEDIFGATLSNPLSPDPRLSLPYASDEE